MRLARFAPFVFALAVVAGAIRPAHAAADPRALFARERRASGGDAWNAVAAVRVDGVTVMGGAPSRFTQLTDRANGFTKATAVIGPVTDVSGYDGVAWDFQGSTVTLQTLPGSVADNITQAYVARDGWWRRDDPATMTALGAAGRDDGVRVVPKGGSAIDVWFDRATGLIDRTVAHTDAGAVVGTDDDYRAVGDLIVSFHSVSTDPTGAVTDTTAYDVVPMRTLAADALARPAPRYLGHVAGAHAPAPFRLDPNVGWIYTDVLVGGRPSHVIFDSGASNYFSAAAAARLALRGSGGIPIGGVGNASVNGGLAQLGTMHLGGARLDDQHGIIAPLPYVVTHPKAGNDVDGLIGAEFLHNLRLTFDFIAGVVTFEEYTRPHAQPAGAVRLPFLTDGEHAYVDASVDGVRGLYLLDTGDAGAITVFRRFADAHGLFRGVGLTYLSPGGVGGHLPVEFYRARSFALGGATFHAPPVSISSASAGSFASRSIAGNIGIRVLSRYRLTFDFSTSTVTFVPNARIGAPFGTDHTGISLTQTDATAFVVLSTVTGSPAARAGLQAGDRIVALNGTSIASKKLGLSDATPFVRGSRTYTLTTQAKDGTTSTVTIHPRVLLP